MSKKILTTVVAALVCVAVTSARAADQVPSGTLSQMGLSGLHVMSDSESMAVRGKFAIAGGISIAHVGPGGILTPPAAGSLNFYLGVGKFEASGTNASAATITQTQIKTVVFMDGSSNSLIKVRSLSVAAAGSSSAKGF